MRAGTKRHEQKERTRARILDEAIGLFARKGYGSTSIHELVSTAGVTTGCLYCHFDSKEDVLIAVLAELKDRLFRDLLGAMPLLGGEKPKVTVAALIERVARIVEQHAELFHVVGVVGVEAAHSNPRIEAALRASYSGIAPLLRALLESAGAEHASDDFECAAQMFLGLYMGGILHQRLFRKEFPLSRALPVLTKMLASAALPR